MPKLAIPVVVLSCCLLQACERSTPAPASGSPASMGESIDAALMAIIAQARYQTSPPGHPSHAWAELAAVIDSARRQVEHLPGLTKPSTASDPLAERVTSEQVAALAHARQRAQVWRAESARLLAGADPDGAALALEGVLSVSGELSTWGIPVAAETSAELISVVLDAIELPKAAPMTRALTSASRARLRAALDRLNTNDPAGRLRALTETTAARLEALRTIARGPDGPTAVRAVAGRYAPGAMLATDEEIDRLSREAFAFARALADGWDRGSRSAITTRLGQRQAEDQTGVLEVVLANAARACEDDARLRERIERAIEGLR